ncbi:polyribonucleotide nucleotidyltransferase [Breznakia sp. PF5-3]|uniref:polyribonucleotide nucleotidyltransferase n=1 Tax=unclassified Breznakia TaxID=2623764 RepID=UPI0024056CF2|nr:MULTISPECIES: polyribonucleotide nucleotidyltransferase [unclassified Breznakia]MDL2276098.1 polyribonucleotide nucleotidyltransferase [Breznakia sp. OttesenSCG-928-G09]MDF9823878.1 polyribonucleotide nucleotidyltransferase [Breznakia sp. PM6-1]MDF9834677.1 polyribonucleotide nucleotidyltransferase [Breznakia sp. PF5-3]MDF9836888.1 polyribonucleotide nucleotidyltransferase [Breznakia sp. PFB2-8]MDF9858905.1 polyribonucleotide nucleotidyltransferase [Breznakia sp. PH5-24]
MTKEVFRLDFHGRGIVVETGELAKQAGGSALIRYEDTVVLSTAVASSQAKLDLDFFPLTVLYEEKLYSAGKIPGGFLRREGRPSERATLTARMIDRPIRPLFADGFRNEVQVVNTVLSVDTNCTPEMTAMFGASLALCISDIPFNGPIAGVNVGFIDGEYIINPTPEQAEKSLIDLSVAGTKYAVNMVEAGAKEVSEEEMLNAIMFGHEAIKELVAFQEEIIAKVGKEKREIELYTVDEAIDAEVREKYEAEIRKAVSIEKKLERYGKIDELTDAAVAMIEDKEYVNEMDKNRAAKQAKQICHSIEADEVRRLIIEDKIRPDGRKIDEVRALDSQVDLLPRVHGSAVFTRGETQALSVTTLGPLNDEQIIDDLTDIDRKRFMHHYNFPPYSVGETGRMGAPGRREVGHGALGERALLQVLPTVEEFPYTIRVVAEVLESNGSSSQASICAGTMSLMAAGVPIKAPVAGIAMGLIMDENDNYTVLTDIQGMEDHFGDMDFKVAGTPNGITALQMDIKVNGITKEIFEEALAQAGTAREHILKNMMVAISEPRADVSKYAPKTHIMHIKVDKIKDVIGPGGKMINQIIEESDDVKIDIDDDGQVIIYHYDRDAINKAAQMIEDIVREAKVGDVYDAKVVRIEKFGAFVNLFGGVDGLLHVSKIKHERVEKVEDVLKIGDTVKVKVMEIDDRGRVNVSAKALLEKPKKDAEKKDDKKPSDKEVEPKKEA